MTLFFSDIPINANPITKKQSTDSKMFTDDQKQQMFRQDYNYCMDYLIDEYNNKRLQKKNLPLDRVYKNQLFLSVYLTVHRNPTVTQLVKYYEKYNDQDKPDFPSFDKDTIARNFFHPIDDLLDQHVKDKLTSPNVLQRLYTPPSISANLSHCNALSTIQRNTERTEHPRSAVHTSSEPQRQPDPEPNPKPTPERRRSMPLYGVKTGNHGTPRGSPHSRGIGHGTRYRNP